MRKFDDFEGRSPYPRESGEIVPGWYRGYMRAVVPASGIFMAFGLISVYTVPGVLWLKQNGFLLLIPTFILLILFIAHLGICGFSIAKRFGSGTGSVFGNFIRLLWVGLCFGILLLHTYVPGP